MNSTAMWSGPPHFTQTMRAALLALAVSCASESTAPSTGTPGLHFDAAPTVSDTILTWIQSPFHVTLRDAGGHPISHVAIHFTTHLTSSSSTFWDGVVAGHPFGDWYFYTDTTDAQGRASVYLELGPWAGQAYLVATDSTSGLADSVPYTVRAGTGVRLYVAAKDTAVWLHGTYKLGAAEVDQFRNPTKTTDGIGFRPLSGIVSITSDGTVTGNAYGSTRILLTTTNQFGLTTVIDTASVSVVPSGHLTAAAGAIYVLGTDGSNAHVVYQPTNAHVYWPTWSPDGSHIAFNQDRAMYIMDADGSNRRLLVPHDSLVGWEYPLQFSADGKWIYYTRRGDGDASSRLRRVSLDGRVYSDLSVPGSAGIEAFPSPDPADTVVVFQTNAGSASGNGFTLRLRTVGTGTETMLSVPGYGPRWSPAGDRIAYLVPGDSLRMMTPAGGRISTPQAALQSGFCWSPDGTWFAGIGQDALRSTIPLPQLHLVQAGTGVVVSLPFSTPQGALYAQPSWAP